MTISPALIDQIQAAPEVREEPAVYWTTTGTFPNGQKIPNSKRWVAVFSSADEAEAYAVRPKESGWVWDGEPAVGEPLSVHMHDARRNGRLGVRLTAYRGGEWVTVREWPADVPLGSDRAP